MPDYIYTDPNGHTTQTRHHMTENPVIICATCGAAMWRKPLAFYVNWGGMPPSKGFVSPAIKEQLAQSREWNENHPPQE